MDTFFCSTGIPVVNCVAQFRKDDLFQELIVDPDRDNWFPCFKEGNDGLRIVGSPCVIDTAAHFREDDVI